MKKFNNKGLTLIEIIVTLAVLGLVVSPLMSMFITSQKINNESKKEYQAIQIAQKYMESIKSKKDIDDTGYPRTEAGIYTKDENDDDFITQVNIIPETIAITGNDSDPLPKLVIKNDSVVFDDGTNKTIKDASVNIMILADKMIIEGEIVSDSDDGIYVSIETSEIGGLTPKANLYFNNSTSEGKIYLEDNGKSWSASYSGGKKPEIIPVKVSNSIEVLYNIEISVYIDSKNPENLVTSLKSTNVFN